MSKFKVKNKKKLEELIYEVGDKYDLALNHISSNFIGGGTTLTVGMKY